MATVSEQLNMSEHIRLPTDEEVASFREQGWAYLPQLVSRELALELLSHIKVIVDFPHDEMPEGSDSAQKVAMTVPAFALNPMPRLHDDFLRAYTESAQMGEAAARLTGIRPMRLVTDTVIFKLPEWTGAGNETDWHQDTPNMPLEPKKIDWLLAELAKTEHPTSCPHGRPIALRYSLKDIQRAFQRI